MEDYQTYVVWIQNPDGYNHVFEEDNMWRKNKHLNHDGTYGVDLNRNYPFGWSFSCAGSTTTTSQTYKGPQASSEPETRMKQQSV